MTKGEKGDFEAAVRLLKQLIATPSLSRAEDQSATVIQDFLSEHKIPSERVGNNVFAPCKHFNPGRPTLMLNSHHDTVKANPG